MLWSFFLKFPSGSIVFRFSRSSFSISEEWRIQQEKTKRVFTIESLIIWMVFEAGEPQGKLCQEPQLARWIDCVDNKLIVSIYSEAIFVWRTFFVEVSTTDGASSFGIPLHSTPLPLSVLWEATDEATGCRPHWEYSSIEWRRLHLKCSNEDLLSGALNQACKLQREHCWFGYVAQRISLNSPNSRLYSNDRISLKSLRKLSLSERTLIDIYIYNSAAVRWYSIGSWLLLITDL